MFLQTDEVGKQSMREKEVRANAILAFCSTRILSRVYGSFGLLWICVKNLWIKTFSELDVFFFGNRNWTEFIYSPLDEIFQIPFLRCVVKGTYFHLCSPFPDAIILTNQ